MAEHVAYPILDSCLIGHFPLVDLENLSDLFDLADDSDCPVFYQEKYQGVPVVPHPKGPTVERWLSIVKGVALVHVVKKDKPK